jgi:predicted transcriptional regulator
MDDHDFTRALDWDELGDDSEGEMRQMQHAETERPIAERVIERLTLLELAMARLKREPVDVLQHYETYKKEIMADYQSKLEHKVQRKQTKSLEPWQIKMLKRVGNKHG